MKSSPGNYNAGGYNISERKGVDSGYLFNDERRREILAEGPLSEDERERVITMKDKFRMVLLGILNARMNGDAEAVSILTDTLKVGLGTETSKMGVMKRWFNG